MSKQTISFSLTLNIASVLQPVTTSLRTAVQGQPYEFQLEATGGVLPHVYTGVVLPAWLFCSATGLLSGTPTEATPEDEPGVKVSITVTDSGV